MPVIASMRWFRYYIGAEAGWYREGFHR